MLGRRLELNKAVNTLGFSFARIILKALQSEMGIIGNKHPKLEQRTRFGELSSRHLDPDWAGLGGGGGVLLFFSDKTCEL